MEWNDIVFTDEYHFSLQPHDGRIRVWRHRVRIAGTLNNQRYISEVLEPVVLLFIQGLPSAIFQQDNA
ncbi:transposable element Tc3 transposase [Trichonephila clavipes]|nr:transposable element Tc3 transposase [Trichonephila clavipes]